MPRIFLKQPTALRLALTNLKIPPTQIAKDVGISPTSAYRIAHSVNKLPSLTIARQIIDYYNLDPALGDGWDSDEMTTMLNHVINFTTAEITLGQLAHLLQCDRASVYAWKKGKSTPTFARLSLLCAVALRLQNHQISRMPSYRNLIATIGFNPADLDTIPVEYPSVRQATSQYLSLSGDNFRDVAAKVDIKAGTLYGWHNKCHAPQLDKLIRLVNYVEDQVGEDITSLPAHNVIHDHIEKRQEARKHW